MRLTLLSHMFWGSWAVVQAGHSSIDFDYMAYASKRFGGYFYHKNIVYDE
jgi:ethanolamine kinase